MAKDEANASNFAKGLLRSEDLYKYILETSVYPREPEALKELRDITYNHPRAEMATAPDGGQLMGMLLSLVNARKTIEVGVFTGYSLLLTALTLPDDGKVIAIDMNRESYEIGLPVIKNAGVEHKIDFRESEALPVLDELLTDKKNEGGFDFAYVDADKVNYWNYHERLLRLVKVGGIIMYDNTLWGGSVAEPDSSTPEWRREGKKLTLELNKKLSADQRVQISQAALGDGITICRRRHLCVWGTRLPSTMAKNEAESSEFSKGLLRSEELYKYTLETSVYPREPEALKELRNITRNHPRANMATAPDAAQLMGMLLGLVDARKTIEVGVFTGYSLLLTALTLPDDGKVIAIDVNRESYEIGLPVIKKAGVEHKIDFRESEALPVLDELLADKTNEGGFDFAYVDANKESYWNYHERLMRLIRVGGLIVYDNTLWGGSVVEPDSSTPEGKIVGKKAILELNQKLSADPRVQISQAALGDGITICRRLY